MPKIRELPVKVKVKEIHKSFIDLMGYARQIDDLSIVPIQIDVIGENCEVSFMVINKMGMRRKITRKGKHKDYIFTTSVYKTPFTINLKTNVIKKVRLEDIG